MAFPASYFTGPLGANTPVPSVATGYLLGEWYGDGVANDVTRARVLQRQTDMGRNFDFIGSNLTALDFGGVNGEVWVRDTAQADFYVCCFQPGFTVAQMASGSMDATWAAHANRLKLVAPFRIIYRTMYEFNLTGAVWNCGTTAQSAADFVTAWRRMVGIFQTNGASNVGFWWCPVEGGALGNDAQSIGRTQVALAYPGDAYVDWIGVDKYNHNSGFSTPTHAGWAEPDELVNYFYTGTPPAGQRTPYYREYGMNKAFVVGETGCKYDNTVGQGARKGTWYKNWQLAKNRMNALSGDSVNGLRGIMFFDQWVSGEGNDWHVDSNQPAGTSTKGGFDATTYTGWKEWTVGTNQPNPNTTPGQVDINVGTAVVGGGDTTPPTAPTSLAATANSSSQITLTWTAATDNVGVTQYRIERCSGAGCSNFVQVGTDSASPFTDSGLTASTSYSYRIRASDAAGNLGAYSSTVTRTTLASGGGYTATVWVNDTTPAINATNLNHLSAELASQALSPVLPGGTVSNTLPAWTNDAAPAVSDPVPLQEMERVTKAVSDKLGVSPAYTVTTWAAGWSPARNAANLNKLEARAVANRSALDALAPPSTAYFYEDWSTGRAETVRWDNFYSYSAPGAFGTPLSSTPDGRVAVVNDPAGGGGKCVRCEVRDSDPVNFSVANTDKSEIETNATKTWNGSFTLGTIRWFEWDIYLPYNVSEKFEWPHGDGTVQRYLAMFGLHPPNSTTYSAVHLGWEEFQFKSTGDSYQDKNVFLNFHVEGGTYPEITNSRIINLLRLTDGNAVRVAANHNRWIHLVWGMKFNPDNTGWFEAWIDGVNVYPRTNGPTMWTNDGANYFKYGLYDVHVTTFPETGRSVVYYGKTTIGTQRPF